jgi:hypothetical protein
MKILFSIFLIIGRLWIGFTILSWVIKKMMTPTLHNISEIEVYLVLMIFDTWISISQNNIDISIVKKES